MINKKKKRIAFLFPGQGAQYPTMGKDFAENFSAARLTFEEADDLLNQSISSLIFNGPEEVLTQTCNSQIAIYATSMALLRVVLESYDIKPYVCAGLSLGEYTALTAAECLSFREALPLVQYRGQFMNDACEETRGAMAAVMGLDGAIVAECVKKLQLPDDLWIANYNCPGQVVLSGTVKGIEAGTKAVKEAGAKRIFPLQVHGAFHSGLMKKAELRLAPHIERAPIKQGVSKVVMNVPGDFVSETERMRHNLIDQVTHSVRWEQGIMAIERENIDLYIEFGPGNTLAGMNKRIGINAPTLSINKVEDLDQLSNI